jgi:hypothetical protein
MTRSEDTLTTRDLASPTPAPEEVEEVRPETAAEPRDEVTRETAAEPRDEVTPETAAEPRAEDDGPLLPESQGAELQTRWEAIQVRFVDDPRNAVEEADALVASTMQQLADGFASAREDLERQWSRGEDISTEDLRVALQRYRSFFKRLLAA